MPKTGHILSVKVTGNVRVKVTENIRVPYFSELEIVAQVKGCTNDTNSCYFLESNLQNSNILVVRAVVTMGKFVPVCLLSLTGESINLYSGCSLAKLSEVEMVLTCQRE